MNQPSSWQRNLDGWMLLSSTVQHQTNKTNNKKKSQKKKSKKYQEKEERTQEKERKKSQEKREKELWKESWQNHEMKWWIETHSSQKRHLCFFIGSTGFHLSFFFAPNPNEPHRGSGGVARWIRASSVARIAQSQSADGIPSALTWQMIMNRLFMGLGLV